ncbi:MAG TPA: 30S ribosomal protein S1, partial [Myxococcales bacterium]|nr:30S ribosomal protein S1 [Myxococcales bacterium]
MANPQTDLIGGEEENFAAMLEESFKGKGTAKGGELKENEIVRGTVVQLTKDYAVVDIGYKSEG